jgi:RNA polymerase sigma-70 factor (ECF subfamily)
MSNIDGLIQRWQTGDEGAAAAIYNQYQALTYGLARTLLGDAADAEEVTQDSLAYALTHIDQYDAQRARFSTWLHTITISRCRNKRRRKLLPTFSLEKLIHQDIGDPEETALDDLLVLDERQKRVWAALQQLSPKLREVTVLRYYQGLRYKEIGDILNIPPKTAESRMRLAHKALRKLLEGSLDEPDEESGE